MVVVCPPRPQRSTIERTRRSTRSTTSLHRKGLRKTKRESIVTGPLLRVMKTQIGGQGRDRRLRSTSAGRSGGIGLAQEAMIVKIAAADIIAQGATLPNGPTTTADQPSCKTMHQAKSCSQSRTKFRVQMQKRRISVLIWPSMGTDSSKSKILTS